MTTVFSAVLIMALAISVTLFAILINNIYTQKRSDRLLSAFNDAAREFNFSLSKMERIGSRVIALDDDKNRILFVGREKKKYDGYLVDLAEIENFSVEKKYELSGAAYIKHLGADAFVDRVVLQLNYKNGARPLSLPFYEKGRDPIYEIGQRTEQAEEWLSLLSRRLRKNGYETFGYKEGILYGHRKMTRA
jgi:hypothetical protein